MGWMAGGFRLRKMLHEAADDIRAATDYDEVGEPSVPAQKELRTPLALDFLGL